MRRRHTGDGDVIFGVEKRRDGAANKSLANETGLVRLRRDGVLPGAAGLLDLALAAAATSAELASEQLAGSHRDVRHGGADEHEL